jgi:hypothetical protein
MEKTISIVDMQQEVKDFLQMEPSIKKNLLYQRRFQGNGCVTANVLIREDGTVHYSYTVYRIKRGKAFFLKKDQHHGFTVDPKGKMKVWFGGKLHSIPCLNEVLLKLNKEWVKNEYLQFMTPSVMGKVIAGKITNPHDLFTAILKLYRVKNASASKLRTAVEKNILNKTNLLQGIAIAKNLDHYVDFLSNNNGLVHGTVPDMIQQALVLERKIDFNWSMKRMDEEHKKWTDDLMDLESDSMSKEPLEWLKPFRQFSTGSYKLLDTEFDVFAEGKRMKHCVFTNYWTSIQHKSYVVFHVDDGSEYGYTLGLHYSKHDGLTYSQMTTRFNAMPSEYYVRSVNLWIHSINNKLKHVQHESEQYQSVW